MANHAPMARRRAMDQKGARRAGGGMCLSSIMNCINAESEMRYQLNESRAFAWAWLRRAEAFPGFLAQACHVPPEVGAERLRGAAGFNLRNR